MLRLQVLISQLINLLLVHDHVGLMLRIDQLCRLVLLLGQLG